MIPESFHDLLMQIVHRPWVSAGVVVNLILIESLLSVDNAAVLAIMVKDLPRRDRPKALHYGLFGAYIFRGLALLFASFLISIWWFKPLGGCYLIYLAGHYFTKRHGRKPPEDLADEAKEQKRSMLYRKTLGALGPFWATVLMVEVMDMAFSIDNVVAANAYSKNIILVWAGVFIGILAMRYSAQAFMKLMERFPFLEVSAYSVIAMLGIKLSLSFITHFHPCSDFAIFLEGKSECLIQQGLPLVHGHHGRVWGDIITSFGSLALFLIPVFSSLLFKWPRRQKTDVPHP